jgi:hypothetical protein
MDIDEALFKKSVAILIAAGGGAVGMANEAVSAWLDKSGLPVELIVFFKRYSPKTELWAGAGAIFEENSIVRWNDDFPEAMRTGLLIIGSAPNGDHIVLDFAESSGAVGYLSHEQDLSICAPRNFFTPVARSIGEFLVKINDEGQALPEDYFDAVEKAKK